MPEIASPGTADRYTLPPIVLHQQQAIDNALTLAAKWDKEAAVLTEVAEYTRLHGTSSVADRYAVRARALTGHAVALRSALDTVR